MTSALSPAASAPPTRPSTDAFTTSSSNAASYFGAGLKGRWKEETRFEDRLQVTYEIAEDTLAGGLVHIGVLTGREIENLEAAKGTRSTLTGVDSGFVRLNEMTSGLQKKDLLILAARPSMGKTSLAVNICTHAAIRGNKKEELEDAMMTGPDADDAADE